MIKRTLLLVSLMLCSISEVFAQDRYDLYQLIQMAISNNHELKSYYFNSVAESKEVDKSFAYFLPQARYSKSQGRSSSDITNTQGQSTRDYKTQNESLTIKQTIFNAAYINNYFQSKETSLKALYDYESKKVDVVTDVVKLYTSILNDKQLIAYTENQIDAVKAQYAQAQRNYGAGRGSMVEVNQFKASLSMSESKLLEYKNGLLKDTQTLELATGTTNLDLKGAEQENVLAAAALIDLKDFEFYSAIAIKSSPNILSATHDSYAANSAVNSQRSGHLPTLDLVLSKTRSESDYVNTIGSKYDTDAITFQLNLPIYQGGYTNASVSQAQATATEKEEKLNAIQEQVINTLRKYYLDTKTSIMKISALDESVKSYKFTYEAAKMGHEKGLRSYIDLLVTQDKFYDATRELNKERFNLILNYLSMKIAINDLNQEDQKIIGDYF